MRSQRTCRIPWIGATLLLAVFSSQPRIFGANMLLRDGLHQGELQYLKNVWLKDKQPLRFQDLNVIYFSKEPPPSFISRGILLDQGDLLLGTVKHLEGEQLQFVSGTLEKVLTLKTAQCAAILFPQAVADSPERSSFLRPIFLQAAQRKLSVRLVQVEQDLPGMELYARFQPGRLDAIFFQNQDRLRGKLARLGERFAAIEQASGELLTPERNLLQCVTFKTASKKGSVRQEEIFLRLRRGDLLRGRILQLDGQALQLETAFADNLTIPVDALAACYPVEHEGHAWLSQRDVLRSRYVPYFDELCQPRRNQNLSGDVLSTDHWPCDLGLAIQPETELEYGMKEFGGGRFLTWVGPAQKNPAGSSAHLEISADEKVLWTGEVNHSQAPLWLNLALPEAERLYLKVHFIKDRTPAEIVLGWAALCK